MSNETSLELKIAKTEDKTQIIAFLRSTFYKDEPLNKFIGLVNPDNPTNEEAEHFSLTNFDQGCTVLALLEGKLVGICLGDVIHKNDDDQLPEVENEPLAKLMGIFQYLSDESKVFERFPDCDRGIVVNIVSVDESYRGHGIAKKMLNKMSELGGQKNCGFIKIDCTSSYSAAAVKSLNFELIYSLNYSDYLVNNEIVFKPELPHVAATVYVKKIEH